MYLRYSHTWLVISAVLSELKMSQGHTVTYSLNVGDISETVTDARWSRCYYRPLIVWWPWVTFKVINLLRAFSMCFCTAVQQLTRCQLRQCVARCLCDSWALCWHHDRLDKRWVGNGGADDECVRELISFSHSPLFSLSTNNVDGKHTRSTTSYHASSGTLSVKRLWALNEFTCSHGSSVKAALSDTLHKTDTDWELISWIQFLIAYRPSKTLMFIQELAHGLATVRLCSVNVKLVELMSSTVSVRRHVVVRCTEFEFDIENRVLSRDDIKRMSAELLLANRRRPLPTNQKISRRRMKKTLDWRHCWVTSSLDDVIVHHVFIYAVDVIVFCLFPWFKKFIFTASATLFCIFIIFISPKLVERKTNKVDKKKLN